MGLAKYKEKRNFKESPEPIGGKPDSEKLLFVVQKHDASHLHYDFRLEMEGVLKSWAVPKGPSTDSMVKRLAMMVEDHPYDYKNFEGIIPSGYGAGTVIVWDNGYYEPSELRAKDKKGMDKEIKQQLNSGKVKIRMFGEKLKGEYALIKALGRGENAWLLFKIADEYETTSDILDNDKSVISKKTLAQIKKTSKKIYGEEPAKSDKKTVSGKSDEKPVSKKLKEAKDIESSIEPAEVKFESDTAALLKAAKKQTFPEKLGPMLATLVDKPMDEPGWIYEIKWDGYRALAFINKGKLELKSRNDKSFNDKFYPVITALKKWGVNAILDGEVVVVDANGVSNFGNLQNWRSEADGELLFYVFDILWHEGKNLADLTLTKRREILKSIVPEEGLIRFSENFGESATEFMAAAVEMGLEGIIAKKADSVYTPGLRSKAWLKIKANKRQEMVIGGYTKNDGTSKNFSSLLCGVFDDGQLVYTGKVGTGFNEKTQKEMLELFKPLIVKNSPFIELPDINKPSRFRQNPPHAEAFFLKPKLVCEVSFTEITSDGVMRHPSFEGMRIDKNANEVVRENAMHVEKITSNKLSEKKILKPVADKERKTLLNPKDETQVRSINSHELKFTNLSKLYWPEDNISKRDMLNYYYQVAPFLLPYIKDRPMSLNRHPNGIHGKSFYQKDITGKAPDWVEKFLYHSDADERDKHFLVGSDESSLMYMASLGCIEINPWNSRVQSPDTPDWCVIDLDPDKKNTFDQVIEAANVTRSVLDSLGVVSYPKTSGSSGIHIYIPLGAKYSYEQSKEFARVIATMVQQEIPKFTSIERAVKDRGGKMYIDFLQNRPQATIACAYSVRPKPGATVSMPLHWEEVKKGLKMKDFTIFNAMERIKSEGDSFKPVLGKGINLEKIVSKF